MLIITLKHTKVNRHDCGMCEKKFSEIVNLNVHMKEQLDSMNSRPFKCDLCKKKFKRKFNLVSRK